MHPNIHEDMFRRGREEILERAAYERMLNQAMFEQRIKQKFHRRAANWLGIHLVSWGEKLERFGTFAEQQPAPKTTTRVPAYQLSKTSPHH